MKQNKLSNKHDIYMIPFFLHFGKLLLILRYFKIYFLLIFILKNLLPVKIIRALSGLPGICELTLLAVLRMNFLMCLGSVKPSHILECILNTSMLSNFVILIFCVETYELCQKLVFSASVLLRGEWHHFITQDFLNKKSVVMAVCFLVVYTPEAEIWERHLKENKELYSIFFFFSGKHTEANFSFLIKLTQPLTLANVTTTHFQQTIVCIPASHWKQMCMQNWPLFPLQDWACHCSKIWKAFLPNWGTNQVFFQISDYKLSRFLKKKCIMS